MADYSAPDSVTTPYQEFKPTVAERLIIGMLCEIYQHLGIEGAYDNLDLIREAAAGPHHWALEYEYEFETPVDVQIVPKAKAILDVWEFIEMSYERLSEEDQKALMHYRPFDGFDLNDNLECTYYSVVRVLIDRLDRWSRFKGRDLNSHSPRLRRYEKMVVVLERIKSESSSVHDWLPLSRQHIEELLSV